ncbi:SDR family NAD(P)-dependent oxidoreductase [Streptomyces sp. NPDC055059]
MTVGQPAGNGPREQALYGQTLVVIGGSAGIGLSTARLARTQGACVVLTGRDPERLRTAAKDADALSTAAFDAHDPVQLERFFQLPGLHLRAEFPAAEAGGVGRGTVRCGEADIEYAPLLRALHCAPPPGRC